MDSYGAVIPQVSISATRSEGQTRIATSNGQGAYEFKGLPAGQYVITATAQGFAQFTRKDIGIANGRTHRLDITLVFPSFNYQITVHNKEQQAPQVDVTPSGNASALILQGKDLDVLSDDPDELQSELEALAGPAAGPNGGQIYIDGFTGGQLPPKSAIREIRINQNPFSAEYDKLGYGRIEIFTKPGMDHFHGQVFFNDNNEVLNTASPFLGEAEQPGYQSELFNGNLTGPISKHGSFMLTMQRRDIADNAIVDARVLGQNSAILPFNQAISTPSTRTNITPRLDYQLSSNDTLMVRYQFTQSNQTNNGVGQLSLPSQAYNVDSTEQTLQISETHIVSSRTVNETRFQYVRDSNTLTSQNASPEVSVLGTFLDGGNSQGNAEGHADHYELQNYTSMALGNHFLKFGGRLRAVRDADSSTAGFNGTFTFASLADYAAHLPSQFSITTGRPLATLTLFDAGLFVQDDWRVRPNLSLSYGLRYEGQNHIRDHADFAPRLSAAWGLGKGKTPKTVLRAGSGIFYDRFTDNLLLQAERLSGINQHEFIANAAAPGIYASCQAAITSFLACIPSSAVLSGLASTPTRYQVAPGFRAPYTIQSAASVERQLTKKATLAFTYLNSRGDHQLFINNINAPLPGTYNPADTSSGIRPLGSGEGNIYRYESEGVFKQDEAIANFRIAAGTKLSLFGYYLLNFADSDLGIPGYTLTSATSASTGFTSGVTEDTANLISNQYDPSADYGRAAFDVRHRIFVGGTLALPHAFRLSPFMVVTSGRPFNIELGEDVNGDSIFNDRPAFSNCTTGSSTCRVTPYGTFNLAPPPGYTPIPVNYGTGPAQFTFNLRVSKTFGFGPKVEGPGVAQGPGGRGQGGRGGPGGGGPGGLGGRGLTSSSGGGAPFGGEPSVNRRYSLTFSASARNLFNDVNAAPPIGNLNSPLFGQSNALAGAPFSTTSANRRVDLQIMFSF